MKKVALILMVVVGFTLLTGCTDQTKEFEERIELENELQLIDKGELGGDDDEDDTLG